MRHLKLSAPRRTPCEPTVGYSVPLMFGTSQDRSCVTPRGLPFPIHLDKWSEITGQFFESTPIKGRSREAVFYPMGIFPSVIAVSVPPVCEHDSIIGDG